MSQLNKESWNNRYGSTVEYIFGVTPEDSLKENLHFFKENDHVLSIGGGEGKNEVFLAKHGAIVTSIDISEIGNKKAKDLAKSQHVSINTITTDILDWDWPKEKYDKIIWFFVHFAEEDNDGLLSKIIKALKPGGLLIGQVFMEHTGAARDGHKVKTFYRESTFDSVKNELEGCYFDYGTKERKNTRVPEKTIRFRIRKNQ